jgi:hypothetical protein
MTDRRARRILGRLVAAAALVLVTTGPASPGAAAAPHTEPSAFGMDFPGTSYQDHCWATWMIAGSGTRLLVAGEWNTATHSGNRRGMLRLRTPEAQTGPWEQFVFCRQATSGLYYIGTRNAVDGGMRLVSVEHDYTGSIAGMLRARATSLGPWELFYAQSQPGGTWALRAFSSGDPTPYVSAEKEYPGTDRGMLRARAASPGIWERFLIYGMPPHIP